MKRQHEETTERRARKTAKLAAESFTLSEREEREAWAKIAKPPTGNDDADDSGEYASDTAVDRDTKDPEHVKTTRFDRVSIYASDEGVDADAVAHGLTRDEVTAWLNRQDIAPEDHPLIVSAVFGESARQIARALGKSHTWVAKRLKAHREPLAAIRKARRQGEPLPVIHPPEKREAGLTFTKPLHRLAALAREALKPGSDTLRDSAGAAFHLDKADTTQAVKVISAGGPVYLPYHKPDAADVVALIRAHPERLLDPKWKTLLAAFVDVLEAAGTGDSKRRVRWAVVPRDNRQDAATVARAALRGLAEITAGRQYGFPDRALARVVESFRTRVAELQREYQATAGQRVDPRLARMRKAHAKEFRGKNDRELQAIVTGTDSLTPAIRLAAEATGIHADTFKRARRQFPPALFWPPL